MKLHLLTVLICFTLVSFAQTSDKTIVFKVRAKETKCEINSEQRFLSVELDNPVTIKIDVPHNVKTHVEVKDGKIIEVKGDVYYLRFTRPGSTVITVYGVANKKKTILATKNFEIKNPTIYFCGIKSDSTLKRIKLEGARMVAYSNSLKKEMKIESFKMYYIEDTTKRGWQNAEPCAMLSDLDKLTPEMKKIIYNFQPQYNYVYLDNIICKVPDGTKRLLDPIQFNVIVDTTNKEKLSLTYSIFLKKL